MTMLCWRCGADLKELSLPLSRLDECPECSVHLHVCRMCMYFDKAITKSCSEDDADEVREKERANFCDYFKPAPNAFDAEIAEAGRKASAALGSLFVEQADSSDEHSDDGGSGPEDLFK